jgi:hypothetical protein
MDQLPLEIFEKVELAELELLGLSKLYYCLFCQKLASCEEKCLLWEKGGVFEILDQFLE